jgi:ankyrin repeat protein
LRTLLLLLLAASGLLATEELFDAARKGDVTAVKAALDKGASVEAKWRYDQTALFIAAFRGHTDVVKLLIERGARVDVKDSFYGMTALGGAADKSNIEIVNMLLDKGAPGGDGILASAAGRGKTDLVKALVARPGWKPEALTAALAAAEANKHESVIALLKGAGARPRALIRTDP